MFGQRQLRAKLAAIFTTDPENFDRFVDELDLPYGVATKFMDGSADALTPAQRAAALRFSESFGYDMATDTLVRPGLSRPPRTERTESERDDGSVGSIDLWGSRRRERDTLKWHLRRGAWKTPETRRRTETAEERRLRSLAAINPNWR